VSNHKQRFCETATLTRIGGDYDGDKFFITWEPKIVVPFQNAPAPMDTVKPETFGIKVDKRKLKDVLGQTGDVDVWLQQSFAFKLQDDHLGQVTNFHRRLVYQKNSICEPHVNDLVDLHDLIIDSAKNGYTFSRDAFNKFKKKRKLKEPPIPAYETLLTINKKGATAVKPTMPKYKRDNIIDKVLFEVVNPRLDAMQEKLKSILSTAQTQDHDLARLYLEIQEREREDPVVQNVLSDLIKAFVPVFNHWNSVMNKISDWATDGANTLVKECQNLCRDTYSAIQPSRTDHATIHSWLKPRIPHEPSTWDLLKASAFYYDRHMKGTRSSARRPRLVFCVAGREL